MSRSDVKRGAKAADPKLHVIPGGADGPVVDAATAAPEASGDPDVSVGPTPPPEVAPTPSVGTCSLCSRPSRTCPGGSCPSGIMADPALLAVPPWLRDTLGRLIKVVQEYESAETIRGKVSAAYVEKSVHDDIVGRLTRQIELLQRQPSAIIDAASRGDAEPAEPPPPPPPPPPKPCRCNGMLGSTCPICKGSKVVPA